MTTSLPMDRDQISSRLYRIYTGENEDLLRLIREVITPNAPQLARDFYTQMLAIEESAPFLNHELVAGRLHGSMTKWIESLFLPSDERSVAEHMKWQEQVGDVHARINVPLRLVNHGIRLLKEGIARLILEADLEAERKYQGFVLVNDLLDHCSSLINERYLLLRMANENDTQVLRMHMMNVSVVVEIERLRSHLFDWLRRTVAEIYSRFPEDRPDVQSIHSTELGLWAAYKAELVYSDTSELTEQLRGQLQNIQGNIDRINNFTGIESKEELARAVESLGESVTNAAWFLGDLSSRVYELEAGKDPLTRVFNRRFLPSVMHSVIRTARRSSTTFCLLYCDLDDFKSINDQHGHDSGDAALVAFGNVLLANARATDYVFRMGGDEFLLILAGADRDTGLRVADKISGRLRTEPVELRQGASVHLSATIGVAQYDGHPDYEQAIGAANAAMSRAKTERKGTGNR